MGERVLRRDEEAYKNIKMVADILTSISKSGRLYCVEDVYLDYGQDWMWTTICYDGEFGGVQVLCPRDWKAIVSATTRDEILDVVKVIINDKYFND